MNGCSGDIADKPFACDVDGCLMKFTNEDHLMVHKKRHDMVLNLGLGPKGNATFTDQTPTPTRFIRNCEEVGLFQDLQNVNPFEETFKRAVEAVKTGQTPVINKAFQSNPPDDTLHTPNVFPHIMDLHYVTSHLSLSSNVNKKTDEIVSNKDNEKCTETDHILNDDGREVIQASALPEPKKLILGSVSHKKKRKNEVTDSDPVIIEVKSNSNNTDNGNQFNPERNDSNELYPTKMVLPNSISETNHVHMALKEKIRNNLNSKAAVVLQLKVPIPKSTNMIRHQKSQKDRFSTFSRNSLKYESKLEKTQSGIFDLSRKKRVRKSTNGLPKEKIEILERNRAAATRCREKKKIYVSYLEKLNRELTDSNKKLQLDNISLKKQVAALQMELLKHQHCTIQVPGESVISAEAGNATDATSDSSAKTFNSDPHQIVVQSPNHKDDVTMDESRLLKDENIIYDLINITVSDSFAQNANNDKTICLSSNPGGMLSVLNSESCLVKQFHKQEDFKKFYTDHSYFNLENVLNVKRNVSAKSSSFLLKEVKTRESPLNVFGKDPCDGSATVVEESCLNTSTSNLIPQPVIFFKRDKIT